MVTFDVEGPGVSGIARAAKYGRSELEDLAEPSEEVAGVIADRMRRNAPVLTGATRNSVRVRRVHRGAEALAGNPPDYVAAVNRRRRWVERSGVEARPKGTQQFRKWMRDLSERVRARAYRG